MGGMLGGESQAGWSRKAGSGRANLALGWGGGCGFFCSPNRLSSCHLYPTRLRTRCRFPPAAPPVQGGGPGGAAAVPGGLQRAQVRPRGAGMGSAGPAARRVCPPRGGQPALCTPGHARSGSGCSQHSHLCVPHGLPQVTRIPAAAAAPLQPRAVPAAWLCGLQNHPGALLSCVAANTSRRATVSGGHPDVVWTSWAPDSQVGLH